MAAVSNEPVWVDEVLSFADDFLALVNGSKQGEAFVQTGASARMLQSACRSDLNNLELQVQEYQEKNHMCMEKIDKVKAETIGDDELEAKKTKLEERLQEEKQLRQDIKAVRDELEELDRQRVHIEERKAAAKEKEKELKMTQKTLSMLVSVTKIMGNLEDQDKISGYTVDDNKKKVDSFEFEKTRPPFEICNELWEKIY